MRYLLTCLVALISAAEAQVALNADLYTTHTDNVFLTASQRGDLMQSAYIDFDYQLDTDLSLYYSGNANVFSENADLFNHLHSFGASYARPLGAAGLFFTGANLSLRLDRPLYSYRDFAAGRAFASFEPYLHPAPYHSPRLYLQLPKLSQRHRLQLPRTAPRRPANPLPAHPHHLAVKRRVGP